MASDRFQIEQLGPTTFPNPIGEIGEFNYISEEERLLLNPHYSALEDCVETQNLPDGFELAGPRKNIFFDPSKVRAAIVTCGGLCPGLNAVIRGLVLQLWFSYHCKDILGIRYGYQGLGDQGLTPIQLTPKDVSDIHSKGGTMLGSSRGTPPTPELVDNLERLGINMLFTIGGDGTMRGAGALWQEIRARGLDISVIGIPKTIDNDIPFVRRTFGFDTAVSIATDSINAAQVEAWGVPNGIGIVKLMGRNSGYIAASASLSSGHPNFCMIPEVPFSMEGPGGLFELLEKRLAERSHAVIVLAEGAGQYYFESSERDTDASGNRKLGDIGSYVRDRLKKHLKRRNISTAIKYIDPSYLIRSAPANSADQLYCQRLARNAVHAAMAGKGGLLIGFWHGQMTHVPISALHGHSRQVNPKGELWFNILESTGQPRLIGDISYIDP
jgi:6-phosphofructokinase 1